MLVGLTEIISPDLSETKQKFRDSIKVFNDLAKATKVFPMRLVIPWNYMCASEIEAFILLIGKAGWCVANTKKEDPNTIYFISPKPETVLAAISEDSKVN